MATPVSRPEAEDVLPIPSADWKSVARVGYAILVGGFGMFLLWALTARVDGAAVATGVVAVESNRKTIQHLEGGIVREILVRNGDVVTRGQILLRLDPTRVDAQGDLYRNQVAGWLAQEARLRAELDGASSLSLPPEVVAMASSPAVERIVLDQQRQFAARRDGLQRGLDVAIAQIEQIRKEADQNSVDMMTAKGTLENVTDELVALRPLYERKLVATSRIAPLEREKLRLEGVVQNNALQSLKLKERLAEAQLKRDQILSDHRQEASTQLFDVRKLLSDARQQLIVAEDSQRRAELKAPISGTVQQMRIFTVGGVIRPGDPVLDIVPDQDLLVVQAKISPLDIDRVLPDMKAELRFPSFRYFGSDVTTGTLRSVSRDRLLEDNGRDAFFAAEIAVDRATIPREFVDKLSAGIPADVIIPTEARTVIVYLLDPILERFNKSLRER